jgi:superfamily II RNA helicase
LLIGAKKKIIFFFGEKIFFFFFFFRIGRTKKKNIYVINTNKRPVPLEHYVYTCGEMHKIVDNKGNFLNMGYKNAMTLAKEKSEKTKNKFVPANQHRNNKKKYLFT